MKLLTDEQVERLRGIVAQRLGVRIESSQLEELAQLIVARSRALRCDSTLAYLALLEAAADGGEEVSRLADTLAVPETHFFRHPGQLEAFIHIAVPALLRGRCKGPPLRILSAGCATGEELSSLAILLQEAHAGVLHRPGVELLGIDASPELVRRAQAGLYSEWSLRGTDESRRRQYFRHRGRQWELAETIRSMLRFEQRNLVQNDPQFWQPRRFDAIFFRNVAIYMPLEVQRRVVAQMAQSLVPGGYLFLGPSETLRDVSQQFHLQHSHESFYYRKRPAGDQPPEPEPPAIPERVAEAIPALAPDTAWVDQINMAVTRIAHLSAKLPPPAAPAGLQPPAERDVDIARAHELISQDRHSEAIALLALLPPSSQAGVDALLARAVALTNSGQVEAAQTVCAHILQRDELNASAHYLMALCREHAGDLDAAAEEDATAIYLDGSFAMAHLHGGILAGRRGDREQARRLLARAAELLVHEESARILLFGGGLSRGALLALAQAQLRTREGRS